MGSGATFIVKVEMLQLDGKTREDRLVTLTFNGYGEGSVSETITGIPAGTEIISVKEVYTGASYTQGVITTDGTKNKNGNVIIVADDSESAKATITVNNTHDGRPNGGYGVVNRVEANGTGYEQIDKVTPKVEE